VAQAVQCLTRGCEALNLNTSQVPVAHACNLSYSGGKDQEDHSLKPAQVNSMRDPILKKTQYKSGQVE
jgi:hypothetical protein